MILVYDCYQPQFCVIYGYILCCCSEGNHSDVPSDPLEGRGPGTLLRYTAKSFNSLLSTDLQKVSVQTWWTQHRMFPMPVISFLAWQYLPLYLESQSQSIRTDDVVAYSFQLFTVSTESSSLLVCLLCHLLSLCVVVFSLPPSFTCLLLPFTCSPATSSVVSIRTTRRSRVSSWLYVVLSMCVSVRGFHCISYFCLLYWSFTHCKTPLCDPRRRVCRTQREMTHHTFLIENRKIHIWELFCVFICWRFAELLHDLWREKNSVLFKYINQIYGMMCNNVLLQPLKCAIVTSIQHTVF